MKIAFFDTHAFERSFYNKLAQDFKVDFFNFKLNIDTVSVLKDHKAVCCFVNDRLDKSVLKSMSIAGVKLVLLRSAGYNHVDIATAKELGIEVLRVPAYSPYAVAEHSLALLLCLNRKIHKSYFRLKELNFSLDGLVGTDVHGKTIGIIGCGRIGKAFANIMRGFSCEILISDPVEDEDIKSFASYVDLNTLLAKSDFISLHAPLLPQTKYIINAAALAKMKAGVFIINTSRGALIDTKALIQSLKSKHIGGAALDVYEEEENIFFSDHSEAGLDDDILARLITFPNVLITSHQAFLTKEALENIAATTYRNLQDFSEDKDLVNRV